MKYLSEDILFLIWVLEIFQLSKKTVDLHLLLVFLVLHLARHKRFCTCNAIEVRPNQELVSSMFEPCLVS
uniref:Uncharacterized protein n=1 Tax=Rhizophora mucronata TaxID=61149 RepID=A0A2P2QY29_RHIMU